jgi:two-component sensor histidine kinase
VSHLGNLQPDSLNDTEFRVKNKEGNYVWVNNKRNVLRENDGETVSVIGNVRDISERKNYVDALDRSLKEKEMLLAEIHHRVKNNLSIVSSLLELQKESKGNSSREEDYQEIQLRIKSIALVHEKLYQTETFSDIDLADYIRDLSNMIITLFDSKESKVVMDQKLSSIVVNIKQAVPIGLICNELINNCYKYAFKNMQEGVISIELRREDDEVVLENYVE